jgi:hypothetical protein
MIRRRATATGVPRRDQRAGDAAARRRSDDAWNVEGRQDSFVVIKVAAVRRA